MVPAVIDDDSDAGTCAPDSIDDNLAFEGCENSAEEEFHDCSEVAFPSVGTLFCDEKFNEQCARFGLDRGFAFDLRCGYVLNKPSTKDEARVRLIHEKPALVVASPNCAPFSSMNNINPETENKNKSRLEALRHLRFGSEMFTIQIFINRGFVLFERPETAKSWQEAVVLAIMALPGARRYVGDQCVYQPEPVFAN